MIVIDFVRIIIRANPQIRRDLRTAHIPKTTEQFVKRALITGVYGGAVFAILIFFALAKEMGIRVVPIMLVGFGAGFALIVAFSLQTPKGIIKRREKEINREVLFAGRYLLVKMESGSPLFNSLIDASKSNSIISKYFKEIVDEIDTGTPIEVALDNAREYNASEKFKKILWQILAALKTGTEVTNALRSTLKTIANEQLIEIKEYGKKLNSLMLFYMVLACIVPSLGVSLFIIIASFLNLAILPAHLFAALFGLFVIQLFFIIMIKASRPAVEM
ncbi:type II secretion system F family protein [Candidatus Woesearchaeota archaeon]|nr:type II secretion system F family protein [Candidatus Woesearchaeota archaeon]